MEEVIVFIGMFVALFGLYFLRSRENMAMIEKGINPRRSFGEPKPYAYMKYALLLIGAGLGLSIAYLIDMTVLHEMSKRTMADGYIYYKNNEEIYFALLAVGGGTGLLIAYFIEKKHWVDNKTGNDDKS